jgi:putative ABC transport system substrate-binding protein
MSAQQDHDSMVIGLDENDPAAKLRVSVFTQALADLGWTDGRNVGIDLRWAGPDIDQIQALAHELVGLQPDIFLASSTSVADTLDEAKAAFRAAWDRHH